MLDFQLGVALQELISRDNINPSFAWQIQPLSSSYCVV